MASEHHIDLGSGADEQREVPDEDMPRPDPAIAEALRQKEAALERLRARGLTDPAVADVLTLLGY